MSQLREEFQRPAKVRAINVRIDGDQETVCLEAFRRWKAGKRRASFSDFVREALDEKVATIIGSAPAAPQ